MDANKNAINYAIELSANYDNIRFLYVDVFSDEFKALRYDIVITSLFPHHFKEKLLLHIILNRDGQYE